MNERPKIALRKARLISARNSRLPRMYDIPATRSAPMVRLDWGIWSGATTGGFTLRTARTRMKTAKPADER